MRVHAISSIGKAHGRPLKLALGQDHVLAFRPPMHALSECQDMVARFERAEMWPAFATE